MKGESHVVYHRWNLTNFVAVRFYDECGRRIDSHPARHRSRCIPLQSDQRAALCDLGFEVSGRQIACSLEPSGYGSIELKLSEERHVNGNIIGYCCGVVFTWWRRLGIFSLARLA